MNSFAMKLLKERHCRVIDMPRQLPGSSPTTATEAFHLKSACLSQSSKAATLFIIMHPLLLCREITMLVVICPREGSFCLKAAVERLETYSTWPC